MGESYIYPENDYRSYLEHSAKGTHWKNGHKYIAIKNGRYIYPEDLKKGALKVANGAKNVAKTVGNAGKTIGSDIKSYGRDLVDYYNITGKVGTSAKLATSNLVERKKEAASDAIERALIKNHQKHSNKKSNNRSGVKERQRKAKRTKKIGKALTLYLY